MYWLQEENQEIHHSKWGFQQRNFNGVRGKTRRMALQHPMKCRIINSTMFCSQLPSFQKPQEDVLEGGLLVPYKSSAMWIGHPVGCRKDHSHLGRYPSLQEDDGRSCGTGAGCLGPQLGQISNVLELRSWGYLYSRGEPRSY